MSMPVVNGEKIVAALRGAFTHDATTKDLLQLAADRIQGSGSPYTSVYMYMLNGDVLDLEAFAGRPTDHTQIAVGKGVCGTAVAESRDLNIPDVREITNYISCSIYTRSELVVLIRRGPLILGQIDVDSDAIDPFTDAEEAEIKKIADALAVLL
jgi:L-methionine (R)-S-oxide reductase